VASEENEGDRDHVDSSQAANNQTKKRNPNKMNGSIKDDAKSINLS
jgi:hypothetical protein